MTTSKWRAASAGSLQIALAQGCVTVAGYAIHVLLARLLEPTEYGVFGVSYAAFYVALLISSAGLPLAISRHSSGTQIAALDVLRLGLRIQIPLVVTVALGYAVIASYLTQALSDPLLEQCIHVSVLALPGYAVFYLINGFFGGQREFGKQARVTVGFATAKLITVVGGGLWFGATGAMAGLSAASSIGVLLGVLAVRNGRYHASRTSTAIGAVVAQAIPLSIFAICLQILLSLDLFLARAMVSDESSIGYYSAAQALGRVPYILYTAVGLVLLPTVSRAVHEGAISDIRELLSNSIRVVAVASIGIVGVSAAGSVHAINLLYSLKYAASVPLVPLIAAASCLFGLFYIFASVESGLGNSGRVAKSTIVACLVGIGPAVVLVQNMGPFGAAIASIIFGTLVAGPSVWRLMRQFQPESPTRSVARSVVALFIAILPSTFAPVSQIWSPIALCFSALFYVLMLLILGEYHLRDIPRPWAVHADSPDAGEKLTEPRGTPLDCTGGQYLTPSGSGRSGEERPSGQQSA